ncbi:MAG: methyltransferase [Parcubacteria group bacterium]|jgi:release factor glutamine methyltransferase
MEIQLIKERESKKEFRGSKLRGHPNLKRIIRSLSSHKLYFASFENEETIVAMGRIVTDIAFHYKDLMYAEVPLGIITKGQVVVFENGKAVRHLTPGDFIGLFETAYYLHFNAKKRLGNWTLIAEDNTDIIFFGQQGFSHERKASKKTLEHYLIELARKDRTPKPLTELPLLDQFASIKNLPLQEDVLVIAHTHILESSYPLFRHLAAVVGYKNMFLMEKPYSTIPSVADKVVEMGIELVRVRMKTGLAYEFSVQDSIKVLWDKALSHSKKAAISKIVIIDDGADIISNIPWADLSGIDVIGVEQTTRGIVRLKEVYGNCPPVVNVAGSALKKEIESEIIAKAIAKEICLVAKKTGKRKIGIVGTGNIGKNILVEMDRLKMAANYYDFSKFNAMGSSRKGNVASISEIIEKNDIIVGATGKDFLKGVVLDKSKGEKYMLSTSSADVEFYSLLNRAGFPSDSFETIRLQPHKGLILKIMNGGYPINFNREKEIESAEDMQLTRTLLFAGFAMALEVPKKKKAATIYKLAADLQRQILNIWVALAREKSLRATLSTLRIEKLSEGEALKVSKKTDTYQLHVTTSPYLDMVRKHTEPYTTRVFGKDLIIYPDVMSPKYDWAGIFGVETLPDVRGKTVLEIGSGCGIISLFAALRGASFVDAVDINPNAVKNTNENFKKHQVKNAKCFYSNLFSKIAKKYDIVIFNLPYHGNKPQDVLEYGVADENYKMMKKFIAQLPRYMEDGGIAQVGFSTSGDTPLLLKQFKKNHLRIIEKYSDERYGYNCDAYILKKT